jgi:aerobic carbon-monoxide dehydrogenase medium subunit
MHAFEYFEPRTLSEASDLLLQHASGSLLNGGTDLLVEIKEHLRAPTCLINIKRIPGMDGLSAGPDGMQLGATVTARTVEISPLVLSSYSSLAQAASELGSIQVRHRATVIGNICRASPSADTLPPLIADGASLHIFGPGGQRTLLLEDFFTGPGRTRLQTGEIVTGLTVPAPPPGTGKAYIKHGRRRAMELATVGVAVTLTVQSGMCSQVRIVLGAVAPTPIRARQAEALLEGQPVAELPIAQAAQAAMSEARPITDVRASAEYRREMVRVLTGRALYQALEAAKR